MNIVIAGCGNVGFETAKILSMDHKLLLLDVDQPQYIIDFIKDKENILFLQSDATDVAQVEKAIKIFTDRYHRIDALVSTIGAITDGTPIDNFPVFKRNFELNFFGNLVPIKCVIDHMIAAKSGRLIIMSSTTGHHSPKSLAAYAPAKWALESLSGTLRSELRPYGITVDVLSPASIKNRYSKTFVSKYEIIEPTDIASRIESVLQRPKNSNHFIPGRFRMLHILERMAPVYLDRMSGLKSRVERKRRLRKAKTDNVLIVGASSDVGKKLACLNAKTAKRLYLVDKDHELLLETKKYIEATSGCEVSIAALDLSDTRSIKEFTDMINGVDLLINISRQYEIGSVNETPVDLYRCDLDRNFFGMLFLLAELFKKENLPKKIINVLSSMAIAGNPSHSSYACATAAFWAITRSLRRMYGNELQVMEVISSLDNSADVIKIDHANIDITARSQANSAAHKIYCAEKNGKEIVVIPAKARLLLVLEAITPRLFNRIISRHSMKICGYQE